MAVAYPPPSYIDPQALMRIGSLELRARAVVEGFFAGLHRSPYHGFSVEFTEYRPYVPGDDPRSLDWKLYARSDRFFVKRFEDETNLRCHLVLDTSRSMNFGQSPLGKLSYSKADYAKTLAATLGYFLNTQRDAVGLVRFDERIDEFIPARYRSGQWRRILRALERPSDGQGTDLAAPLEQIAERVSRRGMFVLISDLLAPLDELETKLSYFRARGHEVVLFQTLDPSEMTLAFDEPVLFHDIESGREVYVDPAQARAGYVARLEAHLRGIQSIADNLGIEVRRLTTDQPLETALGEFLGSRQRAASGGMRRSRRGTRS